MRDDESDRDGLEQNLSEWIVTWKYDMKPDGSWWIRLGHKLTEYIATSGFQYIMLWEAVDMIVL